MAVLLRSLRRKAGNGFEFRAIGQFQLPGTFHLLNIIISSRARANLEFVAKKYVSFWPLCEKKRWRETESQR